MRKPGTNLSTVVHIASGDLYAGAEVQLYQLIRQLRNSAECTIVAILLNTGILEQRLRSLGMDVHVLDESMLGGMQIFIEAWKLLRKIRPDVVHTHRRKENVIGAVAARLAGVTAIVQTVHGLPEENSRPWAVAKRIYGMLDRLSARVFAARVVAVSPELGRRLGFLPQSKIVVIENGIDAEELAGEGLPSQPLPGDARCTRIAFVGRFVPVKRVDVFLNIALHLARRFPDRFCFFIFGDGPGAEELKALRDNLGLEREVHFMGFQERLAPYLRLMDFLIITSDHEGLPMTLLEAMALNVPVIAHAVGGIPQVLGSGEFGVLVEHQNIAEYAAAVIGSQDDPEAARDRTGRARLQVERRYSAAACAARYMELYQFLCDR